MSTNLEKKCSKCKVVKKAECFNKHPRSKSGLQGMCKGCVREYNATHKEVNQKAVEKYRHTEKGKTAKNKARQNWTDKNPKKANAASLAKYAIQKGLLIRKPCEVCEEVKVDAHHPDYDKPLDVMWLCRLHHVAWHNKHGEGKNG